MYLESKEKSQCFYILLYVNEMKKKYSFSERNDDNTCIKNCGQFQNLIKFKKAYNLQSLLS